MKIAQIVSTFPPYRGGMGNVAYYLSDQLSRLRYNVTVFTPRYSSLDSDLMSFFEVKHLRPQFRYGNAAMINQLFFFCYNYNVIHFHYPFLGAIFPLCLLKLIKGKKIKFIVHYHMDLVGTGFKKFIFNLYNKVFLRLLIGLADKIIVTSFDYARESLVGNYLKKHPEKFEEVPNGVDIEIFQPKAKSTVLERRYGVTDKKVVLFVGALDSAHYFKGINFLLKAFQLINRNDTKLIIVGEGNLKEVYIDLAESFGLSNCVIFAGFIPDEKLPDFYNLCDLTVLPSIDKSEAFGLVLLEAMSCGKPVIASDLPGVRKVVGIKEIGRLVKPKDANRLAEMLNLLLDNKSERDQLGQAGREKVERIYSWDIIVQQTLKIYSEKAS
jgi:glycosyltransferase involved in cell wall biosynthesis